MGLDLRVEASSDANSFTASYSCPCGCTPGVSYERGGAAVTTGCCCGNEFAVGPNADSRVREGHGFHHEHADVASPWGEQVAVAWAIGASTHDAPTSADHDHGHDSHEHDSVQSIDPVCGMTVAPDVARAKGLQSSHEGAEFFFCGKGCKLEFDDDPQRFLDPSYVPSMPVPEDHQ